MKIFLKIVVACILFTPAGAGTLADSRVTDRISADVQTLSSAPHRLPGSDAFHAAADHVERSLHEAGVDEIHTLSFETWYPELTVSEMHLHGVKVPLFPVRPNLVVWPNTPPGGLSGTLRYAGHGTVNEYGSESPEGQIVLLEYASAHNWRLAFSLGAKAVVFVGREGDTPAAPVHVAAPADFPRFYINAVDLPDEFPDVLPSLEGAQAELHCRVRWTPRSDRLVVGRIRGTNSELVDPVVLSAHLDTFGNIPHLSAGVRGAANAALLLESARHFSVNRPERDVAFLFSGSRAYNHQGSRYFYAALTMRPSELENIIDDRRTESKELSDALGLLEDESLRFETGTDTGSFLRRLVFQEAEYTNDDLSLILQRKRLQLSYEGEEADPALAGEINAMLKRRQAMDDLRRALFTSSHIELIDQLSAAREGTAEPPAISTLTDYPDETDLLITEVFPIVLAELEEQIHTRLSNRLSELKREGSFWESVVSLRGGDPEVPGEVEAGAAHLHVNLNLGDVGSRWGLVAGDPVDRMMHLPEIPGTDAPGNYVRLFSQINQIARDRGNFPGLSRRTLGDPRFGSTFAGAPYTTDGRVAGAHGFFNFSVMTENDSRLRDGHPSDVPEAFDLETFVLQGSEVLSLLEGVISYPELAVTRPVTRAVDSKFTGWRNSRPSGDFATRTVVGGLSESRPAENAMIAHWASSGGAPQTHWERIHETAVLRDFMPVALTRANQFGRFSIVGQRHRNARTYIFGAYFDESGDLVSLTNQNTQIFERFAASFRLNLFSGKGYSLMANPGHRTFPDSLNLIKGTTNFPFHSERVLWGTVDDITFAYLAEREIPGGIKVFQQLGPVVMAVSGEDPEFGEGVPAEQLESPPRVSRFTAGNLWDLNENRLSAMRTRGVSRTDLESFHSRSLAIREQAGEAEDLASQESLLLSSASISHRLHGPLRSSMDDLVTAIIILLLLTMPFAFALERLLIGATSVYGRVAGFCVFFILTFGLLYFLHPGFSIASAPLIIFLAFTVLGLSSMVIHMLTRRFQQELKMIQGQGGKAHDAEISRAGTTLAAIGMGMSTMRRRPTRTFLTAITVLALTFTILCFATFEREIGVRSTYLGPTPEYLPDGILIRSLTYSRLPKGVQELLQRYDDDESALTSQWWLTRSGADDPGVFISNPATGDSVELEALVGFDPVEAHRWPALAETAMEQGGEDRLADELEQGKLLLPPFVMDLLNVEAGDSVRVRGYPMVVAEPLAVNRLQRLRGIDLEAVIPLDGRQADGPVSEPENEADILDLSADIEVNFIRLGAGEIAVTSSRNVRELGGNPHIMTVYPSEQMNTRDLGQTLASIVSSPVWVVSETGVERMVLTQLTRVSGVFAIAIPLVLGGLIIFGTLLGSISDREKEIYTFSALGLGPSHVGLLFFAEAGVYAVVGGMGGQLIAQIVARAATFLAERGFIEPMTINFSSTNSLFAIGIVMLLVLVSSIYPAYRASKSANPGLARDWKISDPVGDTIEITFPFTVSAYDITGVVSFLAEHFRSFDDAGFGKFATTLAEISRNEKGELSLRTEMALAPFDLGVTEELVLSASPSDIEGVDEVNVLITRQSGAQGDWVRGTHVFLKDLRTQFLMWRTLSDERIEHYRASTFEELGENP